MEAISSGKIVSVSCSSCGFDEGEEKREILTEITKEQADSIELIQTKIGCARQALTIIPYGTEEDKIIYAQSVLDSYANYAFLEKDWWKSILKAYEIKENLEVWVDFNERYLYVKRPRA